MNTHTHTGVHLTRTSIKLSHDPKPQNPDLRHTDPDWSEGTDEFRVTVPAALTVVQVYNNTLVTVAMVTAH